MLRRAGILLHCDEESIRSLESFGVVEKIPEGQVIIREGAHQNRLYIISSGAVDVFAQTADVNQAVPLAQLVPGDCFGEVSIFAPGPASATAKAATLSVVWSITNDKLEAFMLQNPFAGAALVWGVNTVLSRRLQAANELIRTGEITPGFVSISSRLRDEPAPGQTQAIP
jgi:CRP-like cAMP-binding protein